MRELSSVDRAILAHEDLVMSCERAGLEPDLGSVREVAHRWGLREDPVDRAMILDYLASFIGAR